MTLKSKALTIGSIPLIFLSVVLFNNYKNISVYHNAVADYGADSLQILRASHLQETLGPYSRFRWHHPGPIHFYSLAFLEKLFAGVLYGHGAHIAGQLLLNSFFLTWSAYLLFRMFGGWWGGQFVLGAVVIALAKIEPSAYLNPWGPFAVLMPLFLFLLGAVVTASGVRAGIIALAVGGTYAVQTQIGNAIIVIGTGLLCAVAYVVRRKSCWRFTKVEAVTLLFLVLSWLPPLLEASLDKGGNLRLLFEFFAQSSAPHSLGEIFDRIMPGFPSSGIVHSQGMIVTSTIIIVLAIWVGCSIIARSRFSTMWLLVSLVTLAMTVFSWRSIRGNFEPHLFYNWSLLVSFAGIGVAMSGALALRRLICFRGLLWRRCNAGAAMITVLATAFFLRSVQPASGCGMDAFKYIDDAILFLQPDTTSTYSLQWRRDADHWAVATGIAYNLRRKGIKVCVDDSWVFMFGSDLCQDGKTNVRRVFLFPLSDPASETLKKDGWVIVKSGDFGGVRLVEAAPPAIEPPAIIKHDSNDMFFVSFWQDEKEFRWTRGSRAAVEFSLRHLAAPSYTIELAASGYGNRQRVHVWFNSLDLGWYTFTSKETTLQLVVPLSAVCQDNHNVIAFDLPDACKPIGQDDRVIALALRYLQLEPSVKSELQLDVQNE